MRILLTLFVVLSLLALPCQAKPAVFKRGAFEEVQARAKDGYLLIDFSASWCGPCQRMEKTTWVDPSVVEWLQGNVKVAYVDGQERKDLKEKFRVQSYPTFVLMKGDVEIDRTSGFQDSDQLLGWLQNAMKGITRLQKAQEKLIDAQQELYAIHFGQGDFAQATRYLVELWFHAPDTYRAVKYSYWSSELKALVERHEPAVAPFLERAQVLQVSLESPDASPALLEEWWAIMGALGKQESLVNYYLERSKDPRFHPLLKTRSEQAFGLLVERQEWLEAGRLLSDPVSFFQERLSEAERVLNLSREDLAPETHSQLRAHLYKKNQTLKSHLLRALRAADRDQEAELVHQIQTTR